MRLRVGIVDVAAQDCAGVVQVDECAPIGTHDRLVADHLGVDAEQQVIVVERDQRAGFTFDLPRQLAEFLHLFDGAAGIDGAVADNAPAFVMDEIFVIEQLGDGGKLWCAFLAKVVGVQANVD
jgi:hypothetical protein